MDAPIPLECRNDSNFARELLSSHDSFLPNYFLAVGEPGLIMQPGL